MKINLISISLLCFQCMACWGQQGSNSVLQSGNWYKLGVLEKGIYKIDRAFLVNVGINPNSIDSRNLAIYSNGGNGMLPQPNSTPRLHDLTENKIFIQGEGDGVFDNSDFLLFYGNSPDLIEYDLDNDIFKYENNLYSDTTFYFLTIKEQPGMRISDRQNLRSNFQVINSFKNVFIHELDETNLTRGGRMWFGEIFSGSNPDRSFVFESINLLPDGDIKLFTSVMAQAFDDTSFDVSLNGTLLGSLMINSIPNRTYANKGDIQQKEFLINSTDIGSLNQQIQIDLHYNAATSGPSTGFLDYLVLQVESELKMNGQLLHFYNTSGLSDPAFELSNVSNSMTIWDVSDPANVYNQLYDSNESKATFAANRPTGEFVAFTGFDFPSPIFSHQINNQNLHSLSTADALFITHPKFISEAKKLMLHRKAIDGLSIHLVTVNEIYNEFSSGMQDVSAIRDFIKFIYDKNPDKLKYVLLFGDCSYDYKNRAITKTNYVPIYEARNSLNPLYNFSSDDYFGFMEDHEGEWIENTSGDHTLEIGIGRLPVNTEEEAMNVVNKIIRYQTSTKAFGKWRNEMLFIADDGDNNIHQRDANILATYAEDKRNEFNLNKLYIDAYEQVSSPSGQSSPEARRTFEHAVAEGKLMINYTGHGNEAQLTVEKIIDENQLSSLTNRNRLPFFITATCQFGNYDNPDRVSGGEKTLLNPNGGAIGLLTATRPVFSNSNFSLNEAYYYAAMEKVNSQFQRLGAIVKDTKNNSLKGAKNRNFALLGDPTMRLSFPKHNLVITSVNGKLIDKADTLKALSKIYMRGEVRGVDNSLVTDFTGMVSVVVFDKLTQFSTLGDENTAVQKFNKRDALLFKGDASVNEGLFSIEFVIPKNISYIFGEGKVSMYAVNSEKTEDASGANIDLKVGGSNPNALSDNTPPEVDLFMNDSTFVSGQTTGTNPLFLAKLFDDNGINISNGGFGNNISIRINNEDEIKLNNYYSASMDGYQRGLVKYRFTDLKPGKYTLTFSVYDTYNNGSQKEIDFIVSENSELKLFNLSAFPNPITSTDNDITFTFSSDRMEEDLRVIHQIMTLQGKVISEKQYLFENELNEIKAVNWDGKDANGNRIQNGIYLYKLIVQSTLDGAKNEAHGKLVVFN